MALADYVAGGQPQFVKMMNDYVQKLNLRDTHCKTVHGLERRVSTARPPIWRCSPVRLFTASQTSITCTAKRA
ncbi:hypothetical protein ACLK1Y_11215 [Escherichia coli]